MFSRKARRITTIGATSAATLGITAAVALAAGFTVLYGTTGNDTLDASGNPVGTYAHEYAFQGADTLNSSKGGGTHTTTSNGQTYVVPNGYDEQYGDGKCSATPKDDDSYCSHPYPWNPQPWSDSSSQGDSFNDNNGPVYMVGGGGGNTFNGGPTYDVMVGGPGNNTANGAALGTVYIDKSSTSHSTVNLKATTGKSISSGQNAGLKGVPNYVDINNGSTIKSTVNCVAGNGDVVYVNKRDAVNNCDHVYYTSPSYPSSMPAVGGMDFSSGYSHGDRTAAARRTALKPVRHGRRTHVHKTTSRR